MKISAIKCKKCNDIIYSRARHDMRWCSCESCAIDGGRDYVKLTGEQRNFEFVKIDVDVTEQELFEDWNSSTNKYGLIKEDNKNTIDINFYNSLQDIKSDNDILFMFEVCKNLNNDEKYEIPNNINDKNPFLMTFLNFDWVGYFASLEKNKNIKIDNYYSEFECALKNMKDFEVRANDFFESVTVERSFYTHQILRGIQGISLFYNHNTDGISVILYDCCTNSWEEPIC